MLDGAKTEGTPTREPSRRTNLAPEYGELAAWLAAHNRCTPAEADAQLRASQRAAWRMVASDAELALDQEHADG